MTLLELSMPDLNENDAEDREDQRKREASQ